MLVLNYLAHYLYSFSLLALNLRLPYRDQWVNLLREIAENHLDFCGKRVLLQNYKELF